jgi:hypothetical protein
MLLGDACKLDVEIGTLALGHIAAAICKRESSSVLEHENAKAGFRYK